MERDAYAMPEIRGRQKSFTSYLDKKTSPQVVTEEMRKVASGISGEPRNSTDDSRIRDLIILQSQALSPGPDSRSRQKRMPNFITSAVTRAEESLVQLDRALQVKFCVEDLITKVVKNVAEQSTAESQIRITEAQEELKASEEELTDKRAGRKEKEDECKKKVADLRRIETLNMNEKVRLVLRTRDLETELGEALEQQERFRLMKDISQLGPKLVRGVLSFLELPDLCSMVGTCRAWNFSLHKSQYWRFVRKNAWRRKVEAREEMERAGPKNMKLQQQQTQSITIVLQNQEKRKRFRKKRSLADFNKDELYEQMITQSTKKTTAIETDRDEIEEKSKIGAGLVTFMQSKMREEMHQLGKLRVDIQKNKEAVADIRTRKERLDTTINQTEHEIDQQAKLIQRLRENQRKMREAQRVYEDLQTLESQDDGPQTDRLRTQKKALIKQVNKLRKDLNRVKKDRTKFGKRVDALAENLDVLP